MDNKPDVHVAVRQRVARQVRKIRTFSGLTQEELANRSGLVFRHIQKVEAGDVNLTLNSLARIADALDVDVGDLLRNDREGDNP